MSCAVLFMVSGVVIGYKRKNSLTSNFSHNNGAVIEKSSLRLDYLTSHRLTQHYGCTPSSQHSELLRRPLGEVQLPAGLCDGGVLVGLELAVVVRELVVEDGDGHAVEDDAEGDAAEGEDTAEVGLWNHVAVAHSGNTRLEDEGK